MKTAAKKSSGTGMKIERRGVDVYINGYKVLVPHGRTSVSVSRIRRAAKSVAARSSR